MSHNEFNFERSDAMHIAIDMVFTALGNNSEKIRGDTERNVRSTASQGDVSAGALATITLDKLGDKELLRSSASQQR
jgi:hypothetical protein